MTRIAMSAIAFDAGTQVRAAIDQQVVTDYAEAMVNGAQFPPIVLFHDGNQYYLADGFHRFMAAQRNQWREIDAEVQAGTHQDALWFALGANKANGKRLTEADKTHAVAMALMQWPEKMQREIAEQVGCSESLVSKVARDTAKNTSGETGLRGRALATKTKRDAIREMVLAGAQSIDIKKKLNAHSEVIADVRKELGLSTVDYSRAAVKERRARMRELAAGGYSSVQIADAVGMSLAGCRDALRNEGIDVPADRVVGKTKRHDANRIIAQIVADAENLTEGVDLVDFEDLDRSSLAEWLASLTDSRNKLGSLIRRLMKEQQRGQAA